MKATSEGAARVYLDYNATAPVRPEVVAAMAEAMAEPGNGSSIHSFGRHARGLIEATRRRLADRLSVHSDRVVFTSGGTEANHLALLAFPGPHLVSAVEHPSVLEAVPEATRIPVDATGALDLGALAAQLAAAGSRLVSVMLANNETGIVQPMAEAARLIHARGGLLHVDAVQAFTKLPFAMSDLGADLLTVSAHKLGGPPGVGALVLGRGLEPLAQQRGGGQERRRRAGTENLPGIVGFGAALELGTDWGRLLALREQLENAVLGMDAGSIIVGRSTARLPGTSCILTPGLAAEVQLMALDLAGIAVSSGAACSSGKVGPSHVLAAMGYPPELARCAVRVSLGWAVEQAAVDRFLAAWTMMLARARRAWNGSALHALR